ncbi:MAG: hypothetical protein AABY22_06310 [Nanoarchaeota archaeon]
MSGIIREPTSAELIPVPGPSGDDDGGMIPLDKAFPEKIIERIAAKKELEVNRRGIPFAIASLREDIKVPLEKWKLRFRKRKFVDIPNDPLPMPEWDKYSDLNNFEIIKEFVKGDPYLSDKYRLPISFKHIVYRFKGHSHTYTVMEPTEEAVKRAQLEMEEASGRRLKSIIHPEETIKEKKVK